MPKNYRSLKFILLPLVVILLQSSCKDTCSKKVTCPGYNDLLLDSWFPYHNNQVLIFKSNTNLSDTFVLHLSDSTVAYTYNSTTASNGCSQSKTLNTIKQDSAYRQAFKISLSSQNENTSSSGKNAYINFYDKGFNGMELGDNGFSSYSFNGGPANNIPQNLFNYSLNGRVYPFAQSFTGDAAFMQKPGVYKITFAKKYGIIAYETNPGNITWLLQ